MSNYKRVFLDGYSYYITIVTHKRIPILVDNIILLRQSFAYSKQMFDYDIDAIVIMPDHLHMIMRPKYATQYPKIIGTIKSYFSKHLDASAISQSISRTNKRYKPIWQKRYHERTIREESERLALLEYIKNNPVKHGIVKNQAEWEYSSFYKRRQMLESIAWSS